jgi:spermidine/putrescine-binding protein
MMLPGKTRRGRILTALSMGGRVEAAPGVSRGSAFALLLLFVALPACERPEPVPPPTKELVLFNWEEYYDLSVLADFEERTGIHVRVEEYGQASELIARFQSNPSGYDLVITDGPTISFLIKAKLLAALDRARLPNFKHISEAMKGFYTDPENRYSVPYLYGTTGLAVNTRFVTDPITSWRDLLSPEYKGRIALFADPHEAMTAILGCLGASVNTIDPEMLRKAEEVAHQLRAQEVILSDYYPLQDRLIQGEIWITMAYSGDLLKATEEHPEIAYVIPEEGSNRWLDSYAISRSSRNVEAAHAFLDFAMEPEVAARISNSQFYASPNESAAPMIDPSILANPVIYPPREVLDRCQYLQDLGEANDAYMRIYSMLTATPGP